VKDIFALRLYTRVARLGNFSAAACEIVGISSERIFGAGWHLMRVEAETVADGYSSQRMVLWDASGAPVLTAQQNIAIFG